MSMDLSRFRDLYIKTAQENITFFLEAVQKLSQNPGDTEALEEAHRGIHTLKSKSLLMGYTQTGTMSKTIEDRLYAVQKGTQQLDTFQAQHLQTIGQKIQASIMAIQTTGKELDFSQEIASLQ